jgi:hypothetical protein
LTGYAKYDNIRISNNGLTCESKKARYIMGSISKGKTIGMNETTRNILAYNLTPDKLAQYILSKGNEVTDILPKSSAIEALISKYPHGYSFRQLDDIDIRINCNDNNIARLETEMRTTNNNLLTYFKMKHGRKVVKSADKDLLTTMGIFSIEVWRKGTMSKRV